MKEFKINDFNANKNIFIEASAGTGKTYTIQQIVAKLIAGDDENQVEPCPLEKIVVVTFTEKAAGELKDRIRKKINEEIESNGSALKKGNFKNALAFVDNANIFTIHSFCQKVLSEKSFAANEPLKLSLVDDSDFSNFFERYLRDVLSSDEDFKKLYEKDEKFVKNLERDFKAAAKKIYLNKKGEVDEKIISILESEKDDSDKQIFYKNKSIEILRAWQKDKEERKCQTYDDMIRNVRESLLEENSLLRKTLQSQYKYAIIDEFQDTNQRQWDIFKTVFMDEKHSIFVVGDPKQSIYAFQGSDVNVYQNAKQEIKNSGGDLFTLKDNYRSSKSLIEACNSLFQNKFFDENSEIEFFGSSYPAGKQETDAKFDGEATKPFWITKEIQGKSNMDAPGEYSKIAAEKIIECCSLSAKNPKETRLQIYDKDKKNYRNVKFSDFAVLARTRTELQAIEKIFRNCGIPYSRYKDSQLFSGKECQQWITMFEAICLNDFSGKNQAVFHAALITDFFGKSLFEAEEKKFENPLCEERKNFFIWKKIAKNRNWAELVESIFSKTKIEARLSRLDKFTSFSKMQQIADYCLEYLYNNESSLESLVKHLLQLNNEGGDADSEDGNFIAKSADFDCVQVMTIHASKGLGFPVVISMAGIKQENYQIPHVYTFHKENEDGGQKKLELAFEDEKAKKSQKNENFYEFQRLLYVAYTRATSLMILPRFADWKTSKSQLKKFLKSAFDNFCDNQTSFFREISLENDFDAGKMKDEVKEILNREKTQEERLEDFENQKIRVEKLAEKIPSLMIKTDSYTSLSEDKNSKTEISKFSAEEENEDEIVSHDDEEENFDFTDLNLSSLDKNGIQIKADYVQNKKIILSDDFPSGRRLGTAIHEIFEKSNFNAFGSPKTFEQAADEISLKNLIDECFEKQDFAIDEADTKKIREQSASFVWHTLNSSLYEIKGNAATGKKFSLKSIGKAEKIAETEFNLNPSDKKLKRILKGFVDLIFERKINGEKIYSVLDWKTDTFEDEFYYDGEKLKSQVDSRYSIQRVLYSYCLVKWLKQFFQGSEEEIFQNHFGGIYYVFVRGTHAGTSNGIYQQTWKNWSELEKSFNEILEKSK